MVAAGMYAGALTGVACSPRSWCSSDQDQLYALALIFRYTTAAQLPGARQMYLRSELYTPTAASFVTY